ncbi:MAG: nucleotide exchange factor GrpE [Caldilineaceae bacterium]
MIEEELPDSAAIIKALQEQLAQAEAKAKEHFDMLQRTAAEFQNSKRRQEKLVADSIDRASMHLVQRLLPVLDDLDLAFRNQPAELGETESAWVAGFQQIQKKLLHILEDEEVAAIPLTGAFDPNRHEAISSEPSEDVESGHIIETLRIGYEHKGRVLRPAMVRVAM